ncbi:MAG: hypothetical protein ABIG60_03030 [Patescibacteria group bacterium]
MKYLLFSLLIFSLFISPVFAYNCPFDRINDPFPGQCILYTDKNNDQICDNSQNLIDTQNQLTNKENNNMANYYFLEIILFFIIFQLLGISLVQYNKLKKYSWRKINNFLLLATFAIVLSSSLIILANLAQILKTENLRLINWLHTEAGLIMILFCLEHLVRRWRYFIKL